MKSDNVIQSKSYAFAVRIVRLYQHLSVQKKEARETSYWLRLLKDTDYLTPYQFNNIHADAEELCRIIASIQKSAKARGNRES